MGSSRRQQWRALGLGGKAGRRKAGQRSADRAAAAGERLHVGADRLRNLLHQCIVRAHRRCGRRWADVACAGCAACAGGTAHAAGGGARRGAVARTGAVRRRHIHRAADRHARPIPPGTAGGRTHWAAATAAEIRADRSQTLQQRTAEAARTAGARTAGARTAGARTASGRRAAAGGRGAGGARGGEAAANVRNDGLQAREEVGHQTAGAAAAICGGSWRAWCRPARGSDADRSRAAGHAAKRQQLGHQAAGKRGERAAGNRAARRRPGGRPGGRRVRRECRRRRAGRPAGLRGLGGGLRGTYRGKLRPEVVLSLYRADHLVTPGRCLAAQATHLQAACQRSPRPIVAEICEWAHRSRNAGGLARQVLPGRYGSPGKACRLAPGSPVWVVTAVGRDRCGS